MTEPDKEPCPMQTGSPHAIHPFFDNSGVSCWRCHKTWQRQGEFLMPFPDYDWEQFR